MGDVTKVEDHDAYISWMIASQERLRQAISGALGGDPSSADGSGLDPALSSSSDLASPHTTSRCRQESAAGPVPCGGGSASVA